MKNECVMGITLEAFAFLVFLNITFETRAEKTGELWDVTRIAMESAHSNLWNRLISPYGIMYDYVGELPTPEDCRLGRPNAIGWKSPIANGPMFTGIYLPAVCERARRSGLPADREQARKLAEGLVKCASVSDVPGFIARGVGTDGVCHYPMGSEDQTIPWFYGLHAYVKSGIPQVDERKVIVAKMREVADALEATGWRCPCDGAFKGQFRGEFKKGLAFRGAVHYLFILRAMFDVTGDQTWLERYLRERDAKHDGSEKTRLEICAEGYAIDIPQLKHIEPGLLWIYVGAQGALAQLAAMESNGSVRAAYRRGLATNAGRVMRFTKAYKQFNNRNELPFAYANWRKGYQWKPQKTQKDAEQVAASKRKEVLGTHQTYEQITVIDPLSAAAIAALAGNGFGRLEIEQTLCYYDYSKINLCGFFFAEVAYYALPQHDFGTDTVEGFVRGSFTSSNGFVLPYRLYSPAVEKGKQYPLILHFHGAGSWENDNTIQIGQALRLRKDTYPAFILVPKTIRPMKWVDMDWTQTKHLQPEQPSPSMEAVHELLLSMPAEKSEIDASRIYANGQSMGGYGTWDVITRYPEMFAAAVPVCGGGDVRKMSCIKNLPIWVFHGAKDPVVPVQNSRVLVSVLKKAGNTSIHYTEYPDVGHEAWESAYQSDELFRWLFSQKKH